MEITILLEYSERSQLRAWLKENHSKEKECWIVMSRSKTPPPGILRYIDVVEEALCTKFGASPPSLTAKNPVVFSEHHHPKMLKTL